MMSYLKEKFSKIINDLSEYAGIPNLIKVDDIVLPDGFTPKKTTKTFKPYSVITKTVSYYSSPKRRDVSRKWR